MYEHATENNAQKLNIPREKIRLRMDKSLYFVHSRKSFPVVLADN